MILKSDRLAQRLTDGANPAEADPLVITPLSSALDELAQSGAGSVDLRLGTWFMTLRQARMGYLEIDKAGGQSKLTKSHFVPFGDEYYLHPGNFVLAVSELP
jgi:dCTP deaminase